MCGEGVQTGGMFRGVVMNSSDISLVTQSYKTTAQILTWTGFTGLLGFEGPQGALELNSRDVASCGVHISLSNYPLCPKCKHVWRGVGGTYKFNNSFWFLLRKPQAGNVGAIKEPPKRQRRDLLGSG